MQAFINELSFVEYHSSLELNNALTEMKDIISLLQTQHKLYGEEIKMFRTLDNNYIFAAALNSAKKTVRERLKIALNKNVLLWRKERIQSADVEYVCQETATNVSDTSLAEAAERSIQHIDNVVLLNFRNSPFSFSKLHVVNEGDNTQAELDTVEDAATLSLLLEKWYSVGRFQYDKNSDAVPKDWQTCLRNNARFTRIRRFSGSKGRMVYEEIGTGNLFYVDSFHKGKSSHLEVFDSQKNHLGIADIYEGKVDITKKINGRTLRE